MGTKTELKGEKKGVKKGRKQKEGKTAEWKNQFKKEQEGQLLKICGEGVWGEDCSGIT